MYVSLKGTRANNIQNTAYKSLHTNCFVYFSKLTLFLKKTFVQNMNCTNLDPELANDLSFKIFSIFKECVLRRSGVFKHR